MTETSQKDDPMRSTLKSLIEKSNASFTADDVLREFRITKEKRSNKKLLKILEIIVKNQSRASDHLAEAEKLLEKKDPFYCLMNFLNHYTDVNIMRSMRKKDVPTSTPLVAKKTFDAVTPESVIEIKERVVQAAIGAPSRSVTSNVGCPLVTTPSAAFAALKDNSQLAVWDFHISDCMSFQKSNIAAIPLASQENLLVKDLLYCLTGMSTVFIKPDEESSANTGYKFKISDQVHSSLRDIVREILPLASHYIVIQSFIQTATFSSCGQVLQALGDSLKELINDYYLLMAQLETEFNGGSLTLHKMIFYLRPTLNTMQKIATVIAEIVKKEYKGGQALTLLYQSINALTGDEDSQQFMIQLTQFAAVPYMNILQMWVQKGVIIDPQQEFLVEDNELIRREELPEHYSADYWEKRYTIRRERIPCFLEKVADVILSTGKYLNVIRQCGKKVSPPQTMNLQFSVTTPSHINIIQSAYRFATQNLLDVLLRENDLMGHLHSVRRYLLLAQGDFIHQFMDTCEDELSKNVDQVLPMKLENLLGLTLRLSSARHDPYKDDVHCELLTYDLVTQMSKIMNNEEEYWQPHDRLDLSGLECFAFRYDVKWPVSLVLNHIAISKYQMLFRQLFFCKHTERELCKIWKLNAVAKKFSMEACELYRPAFTLRQRMMNAVQNLEYYMMIEVIEPSWHVFVQHMNKVENVDEVLAYHQDFLDSCLKNCMLTDTAALNRIIFKLCHVCLAFTEFINTESTMAPSETFSERVKRFDLEFCGILISLLKQITDVATENPSDRFINLVHRINFNSFYNEQVDKLCAKNSML